MRTRLTELLGIRYPIILGAMAWVSMAPLVAAVSNAGGTGVIGTGSMPAEDLRREIAKTRKLTSNPFGVNLQMGAPNTAEQAKVIIEEKPDFVTIGGGDPRVYFDEFKNAGIKVIAVVPNLKMARRMESLGADALVVEGMEAGGHIGQTTTMALMSMVLPEIKKTPVIVAGGFADGRGLAAALIMGASGIQMGTAFLLAEECKINPAVKQLIMKCDDTSTIMTGQTRNHGFRGIKNSFTEAYMKREIDGASIGELMEMGLGKYKKGLIEGDVQNGSVAAGQIIGMIDRERTSLEIIESVMNEAKDILINAPKIV